MTKISTQLQVSLALGYAANFALWLLVLFVIVRAAIAPVPPSGAAILAFSLFVVCFVLYSVALGLFLRTKGYIALIFTIVFLIAQLVVSLITSVSLFADDRILDSVRWVDEPIKWVQNRRWLPIAFCVAFIPIFATQLFVINRYSPRSSSSPRGGAAERKSSPSRQQETLTQSIER